MITRRSLLRGLFAMPAVVVATNIMPVRSIERLMAAPSPTNVLFVHPRMFDDLLGYIEHFNGQLIEVTGVWRSGGGGSPFDDGDLRVVIKDGLLGIDWPKENVRIERTTLLDVAAAERLTFPPLRDGGHTHNISVGPHSHSWEDIHPARRILTPYYDGDIGEFSGTRLVK